MLPVEASSPREMEPTRIILVRHGETDWNATGRIQGHNDTPLNATGRAQARCVAQHLRGEPVRALYSSDLARALETATVIGHTLGLRVITSQQLRERQYGAWEGLTARTIQDRYPAQFVQWRAQSLDFAPPQGETRRHLLSRALTALNTIAAQHQGTSVVVVTHGGLCYAVLAHILGSIDGDKREFSFGNGSLQTLAVAGDRWAVISMNDTAHLQKVDA